MSWESLRVKRDGRGSPFPLHTKPGEGAYVHAAAMARTEPIGEVYWRSKSINEERALRRGIAPARLHGVVLVRTGVEEGEATRIAEGIMLEAIARRRAQSEALDGIVDASESEALLAESVSRRWQHRTRCCFLRNWRLKVHIRHGAVHRDAHLKRPRLGRYHQLCRHRQQVADCAVCAVRRVVQGADEDVRRQRFRRWHDQAFLTRRSPWE
jgi:hypothetical protein